MLLGREREVAVLDGVLDQLSAGRGALVMLVGEPGIGKTRLASELADRAQARGVRAAWGRCWEAGGAPAFWPWQEALAGLGLAFPDRSAIGTSDAAEARFALFREVATVLAAARSPSVVVLEDLHAADHSTLLLLEFVAGQLRTLPLVIAGTYRDLEARLRAETGDALARIGRAAGVLHLARLGEAEVAALVHGAIATADARLIASVFETTDGNPLFVTEIVRQLRAGDASVGGIPLGVREIIRRRVELVPATARQMLEAAAVLGVELGLAAITRMVPGAPAELDAATRGGFLTIRGERVRFSHALYRDALYHELPRERRQKLHHEAARTLAALGAPPAEIAHHLLESGPEHAAEAIDHAIVVARHALEIFAFEDAVSVLERARLAMPGGPLEAVLRCRLAIALGAVRIRAGDVAGRELCVEAARTARELGDPGLLAEAGLAYGSVFVVGGVDPVLVGILEDALARLPPADSGLRARTMARLAAARQPSVPRDRPRDINLALEAIAMGRRVATRRELLELLPSAMGALYGAAEPLVRLPIAREVEQLAQEMGDTPRVLAARVRLAADHLELADFAGYAENASAYEELAGRIGRAAAPWRAPLMRSMLAIAAQRFDESERWQEESRRLEPEQPRARRAQAFHRLCYLRAMERHGELRATLGELRGLWLQLPYGQMLADSRVAATLARLGAEDEVRAILAELPDTAWEEEINGMSLAEAVWCTGDADGARRLLPVVKPYASRWMMYWLDVEIVDGPGARCVAYVAGLAGDWAECDRLFGQALRAVDDAGWKILGARMRFELGDLLVRTGREPARARELLAAARAGAAACGVGELAALIDRRHGPAAAPAATATAFAMVREGEYYAVATTRGTLRFKTSRGMDYLARLVEQAGTEIHVLDLVGAGDADRGDAGEVLDAPARRAYRARLEELRAIAEDAEVLGAVDRLERARDEMEAIARELAHGTGLGGRARRAPAAVDRARSAVQRRIKDALDRIAEQDPDLGSWLRRAVQTGNQCSFRAPP